MGSRSGDLRNLMGREKKDFFGGIRPFATYMSQIKCWLMRGWMKYFL